MPTPAEPILASPTETIAIRLAPAISAFHSLVLLAKADHYSGLGAWVTRTAAAMSVEERERHRLVMDAFFYAIVPERSWPSFPAYLDQLGAMPAVELRDRVLDRYCDMPPRNGGGETPLVPVDILRTRENYLAFLRQRFDDEHIDIDLEGKAYELLTDPGALKEMVVSHLRHMWESYLAEEWASIRPMLQEAVNAFGKLEFDSGDRAATFEAITSRSLGEIGWQEKIEAAERLVFIPSVHVGPYVGIMPLEGGLGLLFGARLPQGASGDAPDLSLAEILVRLNALADETRLRILRLLSSSGELRSQEIMEQLALSQSATSRHLSQLAATGYLVTRRCEGAKCYRLNTDRIEATLHAVRVFLRYDGDT